MDFRGDVDTRGFECDSAICFAARMAARRCILRAQRAVVLLSHAALRAALGTRSWRSLPTGRIYLCDISRAVCVRCCVAGAIWGAASVPGRAILVGFRGIPLPAFS